MLHHFTLTFQLPDSAAVDAAAVAGQMPGSDFTIEGLGSNPSGEFSIHFSREGASVTHVLEYAKSQVQQAIPDAQLVGMDLSEEPPAQSMVDDISKLVLHACNALGSVDGAQAWLATPNPDLEGLTPKALMINAEGRTQVSRVLTKLLARKQGAA
ncbi:antitoxin Xre/MbcA/ParS toxin-binding domain-containing protein [Saccharospirillum alexandrii]|uniref:antitoxin Xre/MbcA/ParS toxin-binding domain-containing protein n=1 Tax=Saccharospirillum alexandrii TaxID=2448477 RepID=UPI00171722EB